MGKDSTGNLKPIEVNIDLTSLIRINLTGIGIYTFNLVKELMKHPELSLKFSYKISRYSHKDWIELHLPQVSADPYIPIITDNMKQSWEVFHGPDFVVPNKRDVGKVATIHDLGFYHPSLVEPSVYEQGKRKLEICLRKHRPEQLIAVSDFCKQELLEKFPEYEGRITRIYHGIDHIVVPDDATLGLEEDLPPHIVYLGTLEKRKNVHNLIKAFEQVHQAFPEVYLYLVGGFGYGAERIMQMVQRSSAASHIQYKGYIREIDRHKLYRRALFAMYPSLYEGFGIPILEAMKFGCPVITSNIGAMDEVSGDAAMKINPLEPDDIAKAMKGLLSSAELRQNYVQRGLNHVAEFTWQKTAEQTIEVYKRAGLT